MFFREARARGVKLDRKTRAILFADDVAKCVIWTAPAVIAISILSPVIVPALIWKGGKRLIAIVRGR